jgi:ADP-heptose:LPS heptosyltransferase
VSGAAVIEDGRRTLLVEVMGLGDLLMSTPALRSLREALPAAHFGFACRAGFEDVLRNHPCIDALHPFPATGSRWRRALRLRRWTRSVRAARYEQAIVFDRHRDIHLWLQQAGIPRERCFVRVSAEGHFDVPGGDGSPTRRSSNIDSRDVPVHISEQYLGFADRLLGKSVERGVPEIFIGEDDRTQARALLERHGIGGDDPFWVSHAGLSSFSKGLFRRSKRKIAHRAWPETSWREFFERITADLTLRLVLTGSSRDALLHRELLAGLSPAARARIVDLAGATTPLVLAALLERARGYVGVDTGPMHVAAAVGTPVVALFGPTNPAICGPRGPVAEPVIIREALHCSPCVRSVRKHCRDNRCMQAIDPDHVVETVRKLNG